jgi:anti-anti-sigma factor
MNITKVQNEGKSVFTLSGRLDTNTAPQLQEVLFPELDTAKEIVLDFTEIVYVSSAGLRILLTGEKMAKAKGKSMTLTNVSSDIMEIFKMTGFIKVLHIV